MEGRGTRNESRLRLQPDRKHETLTFDKGRRKAEGMQGERTVPRAEVTPRSASDPSDHLTLPENFHF